MKSKILLKKKILEIEESIDEVYELVDMLYHSKLYDEVDSNLNNINKIITNIKYFLRGKVILKGGVVGEP